MLQDTIMQILPEDSCMITWTLYQKRLEHPHYYIASFTTSLLNVFAITAY